VVQVREKALPDSELLAAVDTVGRLARESGSTALVNDRVDVAHLAGVGVHLGEDDLPAAAARRLLVGEALVGVSTHDLPAAQRAFESRLRLRRLRPRLRERHEAARPPRGLEALSRVAGIRTKPLVAIGGITAETLDGVLDAGADSAAMIGGLLAGGAIENNARRALDRARRRELTGRIYLVGFMGSGKTAIGRRVAERLDVPFVDLDAEIERTSGLTIRALFEASGEAAFRERESVFLEATESLPRAVVATGGGCYVREGNRRVIARLGTAVYLDLPLSVLLGRLSGKTDRPLFLGPEQAAGLYAEREPFYRMGSVTVALSDASVEEAADRVLDALSSRDRWKPVP
jgi:thiamine-phosphate diphosphorylase